MYKLGKLTLQDMNIAVPKSDLDRINADSIPVPSTHDQYITGLSVFHQLHCLKRLRQYTWPEYYHANQTEEGDAAESVACG